MSKELKPSEVAPGVPQWTVIRADRAASPVQPGATVYRCRGWDYGCANEDTRRLGLEHIAVTLEPTGDYPFFTIPREDLADLSQ
jgi:hypothetical protein